MAMSESRVTAEVTTVHDATDGCVLDVKLHSVEEKSSPCTRQDVTCVFTEKVPRDSVLQDYEILKKLLGEKRIPEAAVGAGEPIPTLGTACHMTEKVTPSLTERVPCELTCNVSRNSSDKVNSSLKVSSHKVNPSHKSSTDPSKPVVCIRRINPRPVGDQKLEVGSEEHCLGADHLAAMSLQLLHYREAGFLCDTVLITGNMGVRAHGVLLAAASPVLASALRHQAEGGGGGAGGARTPYCLSLPEYDFETLHAAVRFIYTGNLVAPGAWAEDSTKMPTLKIALKRLGLNAEELDRCSVRYMGSAKESSSALGQSVLAPSKVVTLDSGEIPGPASQLSGQGTNNHLFVKQLNGQAASRGLAEKLINSQAPNRGHAVKSFDRTAGVQSGHPEKVVNMIPSRHVRRPCMRSVTELRVMESNRPAASEGDMAVVVIDRSNHVTSDHSYGRMFDSQWSPDDDVCDGTSDTLSADSPLRLSSQMGEEGSAGPQSYAHTIKIRRRDGRVDVGVVVKAKPLLYASVAELEQSIAVIAQRKIEAKLSRKIEEQRRRRARKRVAAQLARRAALLESKRKARKAGTSEGDEVEEGAGTDETGPRRGTRHACDRCARSFETGRGLRLHLRIRHGVLPPTSLQCEVCGKVFKFEFRLLAHSLVHSCARPHVCTHCGRAFSCMNNLRRHARTHTGERPHLCEQCGRGFLQRQTLRSHLASHHTTRSWICELCVPLEANPLQGSNISTPHGSDPIYRSEPQRESTACLDPKGSGSLQGLVTFKSRLQYVKHCETVHGCTPSKYDQPNDGVGANVAGGWSCDLCGRSFAKRQGLLKHKVLVHGAHGAVRGKMCGACGERFRSHALLEEHVRAVHCGGVVKPEGPVKSGKEVSGEAGATGDVEPREVAGGDAVRQVCEKCGAVFVSVEALGKHRVDKHSHMGVFRPVHGSEEGHEGYLPRVGSISRGAGGWAGGQHVCRICGRRFLSQHRLQVHNDWHQGLAADTNNGLEYPCPQCDTVYRTKHGLQVHSVVHTGEKPFACKQCDRRFSFPSSLTVHERQHTGEKAYACAVCAKTFRQVGHLRRHSLVHSGFSPYPCSLCDKSYRSRIDLRTHYTRAHGVDVTAERINLRARYTIQLPHDENGS